jgi:hypothetical protein
MSTVRIRVEAMHYTTLAILFVAVTTITTVGFDGVGNENNPFSFPVAEGTSWTYTEDGADTKRILTSSKKDGKHTTISIDTLNETGKQSHYETVIVSADGLCRTEFMGTKLSTPNWLIKLPYNQNGRWKQSLPDKTTITWTSLKREVIKVPAGSFNAIPVQTVVTYRDGSTTTTTYWYAQHVGLVKSQCDSPTIVEVLKSYKSGR